FHPTAIDTAHAVARRFRLRHRETRDIVEIDLESGSLLVMSGQSQARWMHEVPKSKRIVEPRINLTFRRVFPDLRR
ncbi:MAG: alpha-ketoglutarate-dependent dioxygenase AlkB, partial [Actinomycetota bacterium]